MTAEVLHGDVIETLRTLPSESVHCVVTSPPYYSLRCYGVDGQIGLEPSVEEHIQVLVEVFREVRRVLRPEACLMLNYGDAYAGSWGNYAPGGIKGTQRAQTEEGKRWERPAWTDTTRKPPAANRQNGYKPKDLMGLPWRVAFALQEDGWWLRSAMPWVKRCLSGGTVVYARTQKGEMPMLVKDLVRLNPETAQLWNGEKWTQIKGFCRTVVSPDRKKINSRNRTAKHRGQPSELGDYLEIEVRTGERVGCTAWHRWPTQRGNVRADEFEIGDVIPTTRLPEPPEPARPMALDDAMVGWFVGLYIAEGCKHKAQINIAGHVKEEERLAKLQAIATAYHGHCNWQRRPGNGCNISLHGPMLHGILETYVSGEGAGGKHLNVRCWERSDTFLMAVLEGYLSGDGHFDEQNQRWRLGFTRNDNLAQDMRTLCGRLGVVLRLRRCQHMLNGEKLAGYRGEIRFDVNRRQPPGGFKRKEQGEVVAIRRSRARHFWDIEVEDEPHLFALASGLLTHNSAMPESCTDRPSTSLEYVFVFARSEKYYWDADAVRRPYAEATLQQMGEVYRGTATKDYASALAQNPSDTKRRVIESMQTNGGRNLRNADFYWDSLDLAISQARAELAHLEHIREKGGLLLSSEGEPLALDVNTEAQKEQHFAAFPKKLVEPLIRAGTSERGCCNTCGGPWVRVVERDSYYRHLTPEQKKQKTRKTNMVGNGHGGAGRGPKNNLGETLSTTLGWQPSCKCGDDTTRPCVVLDPFAGSGTTLSVALSLGRRAIGIEISPDYIKLIHKRLGKTQLPLELL